MNFIIIFLFQIHNYLNHFESATTLRNGVTATMMTIGHTYEGRPQEMLLVCFIDPEFFFINFKKCFGFSDEPPHLDGSFVYL